MKMKRKGILSNYFIMVVLLYPCGAFTLAGTSSDGWEKKLDKDNIKVYSRRVYGSKINEIKAETVINANIETVLPLILNPDLRKIWDPYCAASFRLESQDEQNDLVYLHIKLPWPVKDRDMVNQVKMMSDDNNNVRVTYTALETRELADDDRVRVKKSLNQWLLTPLGDRKTRIISTAHMDPEGPIPAWLINSLSVDGPYKTFINIKKYLSKGDSANTGG